MSKRKILAAFKKKNIPIKRVEYMRGCPTPSGYANGWDIDMTELVVCRLFDKGFENCCTANEMDTTAEVLKWVEDMPTL